MCVCVCVCVCVYIYIYIYIYIFNGCNDTCIRIEPFGTRLSIQYTLQTEGFVGLIPLCLENKILKCVKYQCHCAQWSPNDVTGDVLSAP